MGKYFKMNTTPAGPRYRPTESPSPLSWASLWPVLVVVGVCGLLFFMNLGGYPLFDVDEPRYAQAAREMLQRSDWVTPYFNWQLRFDKPPFHYWAIATAYQWFGITEFSARVVSALAATFMALGVYITGATSGVSPHWKHNRNLGLLGAVLFATSVEVIALAHMSITDMHLALWITLTTLALWGVAAKNTKWWVVAGAFAALGMLTKGPVAIVLPGGVLVLYAVVTQQLRRVLINRWFALALVIAVIPFALWCWAAYQANGQIFLDALYHHNVSRFSGGVAYHPEPWWYFVPVVLVGFLPWVGLIPMGIATMLSTDFWQTLTSTRLAGRIPANAGEPVPVTPAHITLFAGLWALLVFIFFTVAKTKLLTYILPMFPALGLWLAGVLVFFTPAQARHQTMAWLWGSMATVVALALGILLPLLPQWLPPEALFLVTDPIHKLLATVLLLGLVGATMVAFLQARAGQSLLPTRQPALGNEDTPWPYASVAVIVATMVLVTGGAMFSAVPAANGLTQGDMMNFVTIAGDTPVASYEITRPSLTYYTNRAIPSLARGDKHAMSEYLAGQPKAYIITKARLVDDLIQQLPPGTTYSVLPKGNVYRMLVVE